MSFQNQLHHLQHTMLIFMRYIEENMHMANFQAVPSTDSCCWSSLAGEMGVLSTSAAWQARANSSFPSVFNIHRNGLDLCMKKCSTLLVFSVSCA